MDDVRQPLTTYEAVAQIIESSATRPDLSEQDVSEACEVAKVYRLAAVFVRPCDVDLAARWLQGSGVALGSVVSYPFGDDTTTAKLAATRDLLRRGVKEIDTVINIGKMISRQFQYVEMELQQMAAACHESGAILKVAFENAYLTEDLKVIACRICRRAEVDYARTSTPYGPAPYSLDDVASMRRLLKDQVKIKVSGGVRTLDQVLEAYAAGADRASTYCAVPILESWKAKLEEIAKAASAGGAAAAT